MSWTTMSNQVTVGDDVYGSDGDKVGTVADVQASYLVVEKGFFFPTDYYIPFSAVSQVSDGRVMLNMPKDAALNSGWDTVPDVTSTPLIDRDTYATDVVADTPDLTRDSNRSTMAAYEVAADDELVIPVREEELSASVRQREAGAVRVEKRVVAEDRVLEVPVTEEQIRVERRVVDRAAGAADADAFEEIVIEVPLTTEEVDLRKQARVAEEVVVSKEAIQRTEQVRGTVRREEVIVDEDAIVDASLRDEGDAASRR
jgi:uncharacterized protein (TIGR02271 family)